MVGVSRGNGDPRTCDFDLGLAGISRPCNDFGLAVVLTAGRDFDFGFGDVSSSSLSMNSLLTIRVFFGPATRMSPFLFFPVGFSVAADLLLGPASGVARGCWGTGGPLRGVGIGSNEDGRDELAGTGSNAGGLRKKGGGVGGKGPS